MFISLLMEYTLDFITSKIFNEGKIAFVLCEAPQYDDVMGTENSAVRILNLCNRWR
jgi:hypothetical protein